MRTLLKSLSWALVSGVIIGTTAYVETHSMRAAFITALVSAMLKTPVYGLHEMAWNAKRRPRFLVRRRRPDVCLN